MKKLLIKLGAATATFGAVSPALAQSYRTSTTTASNAGADAFVGIIWLCMCVFMIIALAALIFFTVDAINRDYGEDNSMQIVGIILIWIIGFPIGIIIYYFLIMQKYPKKAKSKKPVATETAQ